MDTIPLYPIQTVSLRAGLSTHVIRAWEQRYHVVEPVRRQGRLLYSEDEIQRLSLLQRCVEAGHRIGTIASLDDTALTCLLAPPSDSDVPEMTDPIGELITEALSHVAAMNVAGVEEILERAVGDVGSERVIAFFLFPLLAEIGRRWSVGHAGIAEEHLLSSVARSYLGTRLRSSVPAVDAPIAVIAAPAGDLHDINCLAAAVWLQEAQWRVVLLGANTPPGSIANAVDASGATLALVVVAVQDLVPDLGEQLQMIRNRTGDTVRHLLSGRLTDECAASASAYGFRAVRSPAELRRAAERTVPAAFTPFTS